MRIPRPASGFGPVRAAPQEGADFVRRPPAIRVLRLCSALLPGEHLKTAFYLNCIAWPRKILREALFAFYRYDHVYDVLREFTRGNSGRFSILEFGTSDGYSFAKLLYATRYLRLEDRITVHTFDSFKGMPVSADPRDRNWTDGDDWVPGQFRGDYHALHDYCAAHYSNFEIHRGYFEETLDSRFLDSLSGQPPILIWIDCDFYSSAKTVLERLVDHIPNGAVLYFDELDNLNYGSRLTGEARLVHEINAGALGENVELVPDPYLALRSRRIYRFLKIPPNRMIVNSEGRNDSSHVRRRSDGSPMP